MDKLQTPEGDRSHTDATDPARIRYVLRRVRPVSDTRLLPPVILAKIGEQFERADHLLSLVPPGAIEWRPVNETMRLGDLLGHMLECAAGFCAALFAVYPDRLAHFACLRDLEVNHCCGTEEARDRLRDYRAAVKEGFDLMTDDDLSRSVPTLFVAEGEPLLAILLGNLEHFINHKYQLFFYLKLLGVELATRDLYRMR
ncbi:MAG TPA: DinB family protein [Blastocatellia bacterium]|nr:DinB family protein [Blastocatellia bacterium]